MSTSTARTNPKDFTLVDAWFEFWKHPSPWMIGATLVVALTARMVLRDWQITDALVPAVMVAVFPFFEWMPLVFIPWQALPWGLGGAVAIALLAFPRLGLGLAGTGRGGRARHLLPLRGGKRNCAGGLHR